MSGGQDKHTNTQ